MPGINGSRVVLGGLVAGVVINISEFILNVPVLGADMTAAMARLNLPMPGGSSIGVFTMLAFVNGIVLVWLYAAIRPRYGPGPMTALRAGVALWFLSYLYGGIGMMVMGFFSMRLMAVSLVWGLAEVLLAAQVGAYFYKE